MEIMLLAFLVAAVNLAALATGAAIAVYRTSRRQRHVRDRLRRQEVEHRA